MSRELEALLLLLVLLLSIYGALAGVSLLVKTRDSCTVFAALYLRFSFACGGCIEPVLVR